MSLRVRTHEQFLGAADAHVAQGPPETPPPPDGDTYLSRLAKMIPAEALTLYGAGIGIIGTTTDDKSKLTLLVWSVICALAVILLRWQATKSAGKPTPQYVSIVIALISFAIWLWAVGGPFAAYEWKDPGKDVIGALATLAWTFFVPLFYRGD